MKPFILGLCMVLGACTTGSISEDIARATAKSVVLPIVSERVPGPEAQVITSCIIDNATTQELFALARDIGVEAGTSTVQTVFGIATRPQTVSCITRNGLAPFLGQGLL